VLAIYNLVNGAQGGGGDIHGFKNLAIIFLDGLSCTRICLQNAVKVAFVKYRCH